MKSFFVKQRVADSKNGSLSIISKIILFSILLSIFISPISYTKVQAQGISEGLDSSAKALEKDVADIKAIDNFYNPIVNTNNSKSTGGFWNGVKSVTKGVVNYGVGVMNAPLFAIWKATLMTISFVLNLVLGLVSVFFDYSVTFSLTFLNKVFPSGDTAGLTKIWVLIRDIINIFFIFILLYIAIVKIIGSIGIKVKSTLKSVIVSAIFINFSMFFTKVIIDAGNIIATVAYNQLSIGHTNSGFAISPIILNAIHFDKLTSITGLLSYTGQSNSIALSILQIILVCVAITTLFKVAMMFIGRTVALIILIVTSPVGFLSGSIPMLNEKGKEWWGTLIEQVLVAPVFLFLLLIVTEMVKILPGVLKSVSTPQLNITGYFTYVLIIAFLLAAVKETKKYSGEIGKMAVKVGGGLLVAAGAVVTAGAIGIAAGGGAFAAGAGTAGRGARIAGALKGYASGIKNFALGKYDDAPGVKGVASSLLRQQAMTRIKDATGGSVDLKSLEKDYKERQRQAKENIKKHAESLGPQGLIDEKEKLEDTQKVIVAQAREQMVYGTPDDKQKVKENDEAEKEHKKNTDLLTSSDRALQQATLELNNKLHNNAPQKEKDDAQTRFDEIKVKNDQAKIDFDNSKSRLDTAETEFKTRRDEIAWGLDGIANKMGTSLDGIKEQIAKIEPKIIEKTQQRNEFIAKLPDMGFMSSGIMSKEDRQKLANELRAQKGKYKSSSDLETGFKKLAKEAGIKLEDDKKEDKKEEKPKGDTPKA